MKILLRNLMQKVGPISTEIIDRLYTSSQVRLFKKSDIIYIANDESYYSFFILSGFAKAISYVQDKECLMDFIYEGKFIESYRINSKGEKHFPYTLEAIEDTSVLFIPNQLLEDMYSKSLYFTNWARIYAKKELEFIEDYFITDYFLDAKSQYSRIIKFRPELAQRASLKQLASYLNIAPESLSRIRNKIAKD